MILYIEDENCHFCLQSVISNEVNLSPFFFTEKRYNLPKIMINKLALYVIFVAVYSKERERPIRSEYLYTIFKLVPIAVTCLDSVQLYCMCPDNYTVYYITMLKSFVAA